MRVILVIGVLLAAMLVSPVGADESKPGDEPYTPTKLEWLAVYMQAHYGKLDTTDDDVTVRFAHSPDGETVGLLIGYGPSVSDSTIKQMGISARIARAHRP